MNPMRNRAKKQFPAVLLTLLSMVQALALELLWGHVRETDSLFSLTVSSGIAWVQIAATFLGLVLIWMVYASNVMRFRWVPGTRDSIYPFIIGILEFLQIENLGAEHAGAWLMIMTVIFAIMVWVSHRTLRSARREADNAEFFKARKPATIADFYAHIAVLAVLAAGALYLLISSNQGVPALLLMLLTLCILVWQYAANAFFWDTSLAENSE